jgi:hypothetical protein
VRQSSGAGAIHGTVSHRLRRIPVRPQLTGRRRSAATSRSGRGEWAPEGRRRRGHRPVSWRG